MAKVPKPSQPEKKVTENRDAIREKKLANLKPFKPGQSGNPGGRPKKLPITEIYEKILADPKNQKNIEAAVLATIIKRGMASVLTLKEMAERVEGKVSQAVELNGELTLTISERMVKAEERLNGKR